MTTQPTKTLKVKLSKTCCSTTGKVLLAGSVGRVLDFANDCLIVDFGLGWEANSLPAESDLWTYEEAKELLQ